MLRSRCIVGSVLLGGFLVLWSGQHAASQEEQPAGPPTSSTEVIGDIPVDLRGTWLLVANGTFVEGKVRNSVELYDIERKDGVLDVELLSRELPPTMQQSIDDGNKHMVAWTPSEDDLAELRRTVGSLKPGDPMRFVRHTIRVVGPNGYEKGLPGEDPGLTKDSIVTVEVVHAFRPNMNEPGGQLMADKALLVVRKASPTLLEGDQTRAILASGIVPITIRMKGPFRMYRLSGPAEEPPAGESLGVRLAAYFGSLFRKSPSGAHE